MLFDDEKRSLFNSKTKTHFFARDVGACDESTQDAPTKKNHLAINEDKTPGIPMTCTVHADLVYSSHIDALDNKTVSIRHLPPSELSGRHVPKTLMGFEAVCSDFTEAVTQKKNASLGNHHADRPK